MRLYSSVHSSWLSGCEESKGLGYETSASEQKGVRQCTGIKSWATHQREGKQGNLRKMSYDLCHIDRPRTAGLHQFSNSSITEES